MLRNALLWLPIILGALTLLLAWVPPHQIWRWKLALVSLEFGHWVGLLVLIAAVMSWFVTSGSQRLAVCGLELAVAVGLFLPSLMAATLTPGFSWSRLWFPWAYSHPEIRISNTSTAEGSPLRIYHATSPDGSPSPVVLYIHTGGWDSGDNTEFGSCHRELAAHGYTVAAMSYRLAPQFKWPAQTEDVKQAVDYLRTHADELKIDPKQLVLMGRSAGGQIASATSYTLPELGAKGCILIYSCMDLPFARKYAFTEDILNSLLLLRQYLGGDPEEVPETYHSASAIMHVQSTTSPTLMVHGTRDTMVWVKQSRRLTAKLHEAGVRHKFLELPWATHACDHFPSTPGGQSTMQAVLGFLAEVCR